MAGGYSDNYLGMGMNLENSSYATNNSFSAIGGLERGKSGGISFGGEATYGTINLKQYEIDDKTASIAGFIKYNPDKEGFFGKESGKLDTVFGSTTSSHKTLNASCMTEIGLRKAIGNGGNRELSMFAELKKPNDIDTNNLNTGIKYQFNTNPPIIGKMSAKFSLYGKLGYQCNTSSAENGKIYLGFGNQFSINKK